MEHEKQRQIFRINHQGCSIKRGVLKNFAKFTGKHLCQSPEAWGLQLYLKTDSSASVFLRISRNFQEHLFYRTPPADCFWTLKRFVLLWTLYASLRILEFWNKFCEISWLNFPPEILRLEDLWNYLIIN